MLASGGLCSQKSSFYTSDVRFLIIGHPSSIITTYNVRLSITGTRIDEEKSMTASRLSPRLPLIENSCTESIPQMHHSWLNQCEEVKAHEGVGCLTSEESAQTRAEKN